MMNIPLEVQRRSERRWAARFSRPTEAVAPRNHQPERESQQLAAPNERNEETHRIQPAGSTPSSAV
jgi:hypothetical protein